MFDLSVKETSRIPDIKESSVCVIIDYTVCKTVHIKEA